MKKRRPDTRLCLQYDKLYVNNTAYLYNEETEEIEMLPNDIETDSPVSEHFFKGTVNEISSNLPIKKEAFSIHNGLPHKT